MTISRTLLLAGFLAALACARGADPADQSAEIARLTKLAGGLKPQTGTIVLPGGIATIELPKEFRYLDPKDSDTVLSGIWRNPRDSSDLGMIVPAGFNPLYRDSWAVIVSYSEDGYVKDDDAASINYDDLLKKMKDGMVDANKERQKQGYPSVEIIGWAEPPRYDKATHKFYWAKDLRFGGHTPDTLNYNIRILGRRGVLVLNAVASMEQLKDVEQATPDILRMVNFKDGNRYVDFNSGTDKIATYGLAALVAGGIAAKAGFFKLLLVGILAAKKFIVLAFLAVASFFKKLFKRKSDEAPVLESPPSDPPAS